MKQTRQLSVGTSFHDTVINTTVNKLKIHLGEPEFEENYGEDKVNYEWVMETSNGDVFTIYDWKEYRSLLDDEDIEWHIGGKNRTVTELALLELQAILESDTKVEDDKMKVVNKEVYKVTSLTIDYMGETYTVTHNESFDDCFVYEWHICDEDNDEITPALHPTLYDELIKLSKQYI
jgi:extradiol dioxygenase family protein